MNSAELEGYLGARRATVNAALDLRLPPEDSAPERVHAAMRYAVLGSGKRLRPILALAVAELAGKPASSVLDAACAVEFVHTASLILDDLPCMDDSQVRRGRRCTHLAFEEATALLAVMSLLSGAFELVAKNAGGSEAGLPAEVAVAMLSEAVGTNGLVHGQYLDLSSTGGRPGIGHVERIHELKAGVLFLAAVRIPAALAGLPREGAEALVRFAGSTGLAFQITDDLLDAEEPAEDAGKATFATHLGRSGAEARVSVLIDDAIAALDIFGDRAAALRQMAEYVRTRTS